MWKIIILGIFSTVSTTTCQGVTDSNLKTESEETIIYKRPVWDSDRSYVADNNQNSESEHDIYGPQNEISKLTTLYPGNTVPVPFDWNRYAYSRSDENNGQKSSGPGIDKTPFSTFNPRYEPNVQPSNISPNTDSILPILQRFTSYPQNLRPYQSNFAIASPEIKPPIITPIVVSEINTHRSFINNAKDVGNSSETDPKSPDSYPIYRSIEQRYTRVLPSFPFPGMSFTTNNMLPFFRYNDPRQINVQTSSTYAPPYGMILPYVNPLTQLRTIQPNPYIVNKDYRFFNPSVVQEKDASVADENVHVTYDVPSTEPTSYNPSGRLNAPMGQFPFVIPRPIIPQAYNRDIPSTFLTPALPSVPQPTKMPVDFSASEIEQFRPERRNINPDSAVPEIKLVTDKMQSEEHPSTTKLPYEFGYDMKDGRGNDQHRIESSDTLGVVRGSYGYRDLFGVYRLVNYIADKNGFRAFVKSNEPGVANSESADVVVKAEQPPPHAVAESLKLPEPEIIPGNPVDADFVAEGKAD